MDLEHRRRHAEIGRFCAERVPKVRADHLFQRPSVVVAAGGQHLDRPGRHLFHVDLERNHLGPVESTLDGRRQGVGVLLESVDRTQKVNDRPVLLRFPHEYRAVVRRPPAPAKHTTAESTQSKSYLRLIEPPNSSSVSKPEIEISNFGLFEFRIFRPASRADRAHLRSRFVICLGNPGLAWRELQNKSEIRNPKSEIPPS